MPYIFADLCGLMRSGDGGDGPRAAIDTRSWFYRGYLLALTFVPMAGLFRSFKQVQKAYAVFGAMFLPMLALALLILNGRTEWIGERLRNRALTRAVLAAIVLFFVVAVWFQVQIRHR